MKRLLLATTTAIALLTTAAHADTTLYRGKVWTTALITSTTDTHRPMCTAIAFSDVGGGAAVKYTAENGLTVQAWKVGWSMRSGTKVLLSNQHANVR